MSPAAVNYLPIVTTILALPFAVVIGRRFRRHPDRLHLLWWAIGVAAYGFGTLTESLTTLLGWQEPVFRFWYISGALLGGAPLAQGTVYLLLTRRTAHLLGRRHPVSHPLQPEPGYAPPDVGQRLDSGRGNPARHWRHRNPVRTRK